MAFKHQDPPQLSSPCYIERIPPEIANLICYSIDKEDALNLRLVSKFWNDVATPFMPSMPGKVNLIFKPESFQRLVDIPRHPVIGKQVTSLYYQPDTLIEHATKGDWKKDVCDRRVFQRREAVPPPDASERSLRLYRRNDARNCGRPPHNYSRSQLEKAYKEYTRMYAEQEDLRNRGYGFKELSDAMSRLPNLSDICMSHRGAICQGPRGLMTAFAAGLSRGRGDYCGIPFMRSLLLAVYEAGIELDTLRLGDVNWKFLQQSDETLKRIKHTLRHLTTLDLVISTETVYRPSEEIPICRNYLRNNNTLSEFLAAAPKLKDLEITFDAYESSCPAGLNQIVGDTVWPYLERIAISNIDATLEDWSHFFKRHASTLKHLTMRNIILQNGSWIDALEKMGQVLNLKSVYATGDLIGEDPSQRWYLGPDVEVRVNNVFTQANGTGEAVQDYLVKGGSCPLLDGVAHPQC